MFEKSRLYKFLPNSVRLGISIDFRLESMVQTRKLTAMEYYKSRKRADRNRKKRTLNYFERCLTSLKKNIQDMWTLRIYIDRLKGETNVKIVLNDCCGIFPKSITRWQNLTETDNKLSEWCWTRLENYIREKWTLQMFTKQRQTRHNQWFQAGFNVPNPKIDCFGILHKSRMRWQNSAKSEFDLFWEVLHMLEDTFRQRLTLQIFNQQRKAKSNVENVHNGYCVISPEANTRWQNSPETDS